MDFQLTSHQLELQAEFRAFAQTYAAPCAARIDEKEEFPHQTINAMKEKQLMALPIPTAYGGRGEELLAVVLLVEELAKICASTSIIVSTHSLLACLPLLRKGTEQQKETFLTPLATGEKIGAFALTEAQAGTDVPAMAATAEKNDNGYVIDGTKIFITNAGEAQTYIVFAKTDESKGKDGISAFLVPHDTPGFTVGTKLSKMGIRGSTTAEIQLHDCFVPAENLLGEYNQGFRLAMQTLNTGRVGVAAQAVGIAQGALDQTIQYTKERTQFKRPIAQFQNTQFQLAEMANEIEAARLLVYQAASTPIDAPDYAYKAALAKLFASKTAMSVTTNCLQLFGGNGYTKDFPIERMMRDAKITEIYEGTSEVQKMIIAGSLLHG